MNRCPKLQLFMDQKLISRDRAGKIIWVNGDRIFKGYGEMYAQAIERQSAVSNLMLDAGNDSDRHSGYETDRDEFVAPLQCREAYIEEEVSQEDIEEAYNIEEVYGAT